MKAVLAAESVGKRYGDKVVLKTGSLWAEAGHVTCVVGRNGSGKSTLMKIASGWLAPDHGTVRFGVLALARRPACLVADEPFRGVDPRDAEGLARAFRALAERGCAVVVSGHEVRTLFALADRLLWVESGTSQWLGSPAEARASDRFRREYLGAGA